MRHLVFISVLVLASAVAAQDDDFNLDPPPPVSAPVRATTAAASTTTAAASHRPGAPWSLGLGAGWVFPSDIFVPNTTSLRVRFSGVTLEPFVNLSYLQSANNNLVEPPVGDDVVDETSDNVLRATLGTNARIPLLTRGNLDLQFLVNGAVTQTANFPVLGEGITGGSDSTSVVVGYGLGIEWFFLENISFSADAQNPLASFTRSHNETTTEVDFIDPDTGELDQGTTRVVSDNSNFLVGAIFTPSIRAMFHIYF